MLVWSNKFVPVPLDTTVLCNQAISQLLFPFLFLQYAYILVKLLHVFDTLVDLCGTDWLCDVIQIRCLILVLL
ncbi:hypothetical protein P879_08579 [Paragonimus westermani]|uniref:Uncharacterized protein n=1 Tax=Paragonimus westermani TaxID=34504 RepID=A0A8T0DP77_9TREM|nr:hypothetical protein P879_08579 [Paragonimus westermani]